MRETSKSLWSFVRLIKHKRSAKGVMVGYCETISPVNRRSISSRCACQNDSIITRSAIMSIKPVMMKHYDMTRVSLDGWLRGHSLGTWRDSHSCLAPHFRVPRDSSSEWAARSSWQRSELVPFDTKPHVDEYNSSRQFWIDSTIWQPQWQWVECNVCAFPVYLRFEFSYLPSTRTYARLPSSGGSGPLRLHRHLVFNLSVYFAHATAIQWQQRIYYVGRAELHV